MKRFIKRLRAEAGFTLVELMVVVAIIGLLSAVAIPNFKKYQAKAKTSEAKLQLASLYTAQTAFYSDYDYYASCLNVMGYDPSTEWAQRYYAVGLGTSGPASIETAAVVNGAPAACTASVTNTGGTVPSAAAGAYLYAGGKPISGLSAALSTLSASYSVSAGGSTFTASAVGAIGAGFITLATASTWSVTDTKRIVQVVVGF